MMVSMPAIPRFIGSRWCLCGEHECPEEDIGFRAAVQPRAANAPAEFNLFIIPGRTAHPLFMWTTAFGIKSAIRSINPFEALSGCRNGPSNGEIVRLAFDH